MIAVKLLFVLLLAVPIAALMLYYINRLWSEAASVKKEAQDKKNQNRDGYHPSHSSEKHYRADGYAADRESAKRSVPKRRASSKRKRRKERKMTKKDREQ